MSIWRYFGRDRLVRRARRLATRAHRGQVRRGTGEPYIEHPRAVADITREVGGSPEMVAAAWLHDAVEDTELTLAGVARVCGREVASLVGWLTDRRIFPGDHRATRARLNLQRLHMAPPQAQTIKLADISHNVGGLPNLHRVDPDFVPRYLAEKLRQVEALEAGDEELRHRVYRLVRSTIDELRDRMSTVAPVLQLDVDTTPQLEAERWLPDELSVDNSRVVRLARSVVKIGEVVGAREVVCRLEDRGFGSALFTDPVGVVHEHLSSSSVFANMAGLYERVH